LLLAEIRLVCEIAFKPIAAVFSAESAAAVRKDATLSSLQQNFILSLTTCLVSTSFCLLMLMIIIIIL